MHLGDPRRFGAFDLKDLGVLEGAPDGDFDNCVKIAARALCAPIATFAVLDFAAGLSRVRAHHGLGPGTPDFLEIPLETAVSMSLGQARDPLAITDTRRHPWTVGHPFLTAYRIHSLLAAPVLCPAQHVVGLLAVHDRVPRIWTSEERETIVGLAHVCTQTILLRAALWTVGIVSRRKGRDVVG